MSALRIFKKALHWQNDITKGLTNGRHYSLSYLPGELKELAQALGKGDIKGIREELGDSLFGAQMIAGQRLGINNPILGADHSINKFYARLDVWKKIFKKLNMAFNTDYLTGGSNYRKASKIVKAFASAGKQISLQQAKQIQKELNIEPEIE